LFHIYFKVGPVTLTVILPPSLVPGELVLETTEMGIS